MSVGTVAPIIYHHFFDNDGAPVAGGFVDVYAAGVPGTRINTYSDSGLTVQNANPIELDAYGRAVIYLTPGVSYLFVLKDANLSTIWTRDNVNAVPTSNVDVEVTGTAGEALTERQVVYMSSGAGGTTAGRWYKALANAAATSTTPRLMGVVVEDIASGGSGSIRLMGRVTGLSGLTAGSTYYSSSSSAGALTATAPAYARMIGVADSTTSLVLSPAEATPAGITLGASAELTIAGGIVTATPGVFRLDTEADAASDDLDTITAGAGVTEGTIVILRAENVARVVTIKDGTGNLLLNGDYALNATDKQIALLYDGTDFRELARSVPTVTSNPVRVLDRDVAVAEVVNTITETTVYSVSVPGGTLGSTKALRLSLIGDFLNNSGGATVLTIRVKYGATTVFSSGGMSPTANASRRIAKVLCLISANNAAAAQVTAAEAWLSPPGGSGTVSYDTAGGAASTEDSSAANTLSVTVEHDTASASVSFRAQAVQLELLD